jgi:hypothetical protein
MGHHDVQGAIKLAPPSTLSFGSASAGMYLACSDCYVSGTADAHVLFRVDQYNPFAESWSWADVSLDAKIDLEARAWLNMQKSWSTSFDLLCILFPLCIGGVDFVGVKVHLGVMTRLNVEAELSFNANARLTYDRHVRTAGQVGLHTLGS